MNHTSHGVTQGRQSLPAYATVITTFNVVFGASLLAAKAGERRLPGALTLADVVVFGAAVYLLTRLALKETETKIEKSTSDETQADSTTYTGSSSVPNPGMAHLAAGGLAMGLVFAPRLARLVASFCASLLTVSYLRTLYRLSRR